MLRTTREKASTLLQIFNIDTGRFTFFAEPKGTLCSTSSQSVSHRIFLSQARNDIAQSIVNQSMLMFLSRRSDSRLAWLVSEISSDLLLVSTRFH